jgi:hypothetical protein
LVVMKNNLQPKKGWYSYQPFLQKFN